MTVVTLDMWLISLPIQGTGMSAADQRNVERHTGFFLMRKCVTRQCHKKTRQKKWPRNA